MSNSCGSEIAIVINKNEPKIQGYIFAGASSVVRIIVLKNLIVITAH